MKLRSFARLIEPQGNSGSYFSVKLGVHYLCTRAVHTGRQCGPSVRVHFLTPVKTARFTADAFDTREHGLCTWPMYVARVIPGIIVTVTRQSTIADFTTGCAI